jgi:glycosyltransferase involved in cell wall biosynthesis
MDKNVSPVVSVVLPVYNCPDLVGEAVDSIVQQTWRDFELIVIDDGSTDQTPSILRRFGDPRIRLFTQANRGLAATLNRGISLAQGRYVARQDQDDIACPERLAKQVAHLEANPRCALLGTWAEIWHQNERTGKHHRHATSNARLKFELLLNNPFVHSSVMIRKCALETVGGYSEDPRRQPPEDYELWSRLARIYEVGNLPEVLQIYREVPGSMSRDGVAPFIERLVTISAENIACAAKVENINPQVVNIASLVHGARHRVQGKPDLNAMVSVFREATRAVVPPEQLSNFDREAERTIRGLRYTYPDIFQTSFLVRKMTGLIRRTTMLLKDSH